jgi:hypothetical protein
MIREHVLDPVVDIIRQVHPGKFIQDCTVTYTIKCFGEVQGIYYDIRVSGKEGSDCVQQLDKSRSSETSWLESELVMETEPGRWCLELGMHKVLDDYTLQDPGKNRRNGNWPIVKMLKRNAGLRDG